MDLTEAKNIIKLLMHGRNVLIRSRIKIVKYFSQINEDTEKEDQLIQYI